MQPGIKRSIKNCFRLRMKEGYILNKKITAFTSKQEFLEQIRQYKGILVALNAEKLMKEDPRLTQLINDNMGYPDGIGAVWALRRKGLRSTKIAGAEFWLDIIRQYGTSRSFYLIGSAPEVMENTIKKLRIEFPQIEIKGYRDGYLKEGDKEWLTRDLKEKKPDVVFVAMGSPKQEFLMEEFLSHHEALYMGLGGSFDVYSGLKKRAPKLFITLGLEWFYRLLKEPTRISRQLNLLKFLFKVIFGTL